MAEKRNQHVVIHPKGWAVKGAGAQRATQVFDRKSDAVDRAREIAQNQGTELIIHKKMGRFNRKTATGRINFRHRGEAIPSGKAGSKFQTNSFKAIICIR